MKRIIDFCKKKYKTLIPLMVILVLLVTLYFLYREYKYDNYRDKKEIEVFQYFGGIKTEYTATVTRNLKKAIVDIKAIDKKIEYDSTPVYYKKKDIVLFPKEMSIVFPLKNGSQYRLYKYSTITSDDNDLIINNGSDTGKYSHFFLHDGQGLYFFPEEVSLKINGKEYIKLGRNSYISHVGGYTLAYYDTASDKAEIMEIEGKKITVSGENLELNVSERYLLSFDEKVLLIRPENLNPVFKTN